MHMLKLLAFFRVRQLAADQREGRREEGESRAVEVRERERGERGERGGGGRAEQGGGSGGTEGCRSCYQATSKN